MAFFVHLVFYAPIDAPTWPIWVTNGLVCVFAAASAPLMLELAAEAAYPVSEETTAAYMTSLLIALNLLFMEGGNAMIGDRPCSGVGVEWWPTSDSLGHPARFAVRSAGDCSAHCTNASACEFFTCWDDAGRSSCGLAASGALLRPSSNASFAGPRDCDMATPTTGTKAANTVLVAILAVAAVATLPITNSNRRQLVDMADDDDADDADMARHGEAMARHGEAMNPS